MFLLNGLAYHKECEIYSGKGFKGLASTTNKNSHRINLILNLNSTILLIAADIFIHIKTIQLTRVHDLLQKCFVGIAY